MHGALYCHCNNAAPVIYQFSPERRSIFSVLKREHNKQRAVSQLRECVLTASFNNSFYVTLRLRSGLLFDINMRQVDALISE